MEEDEKARPRREQRSAGNFLGYLQVSWVAPLRIQLTYLAFQAIRAVRGIAARTHRDVDALI